MTVSAIDTPSCPHADGFADLPLGTHSCLVYDLHDELIAVLVPFIRQGLERHERCLVLGSDDDLAEIAAALTASGIDVEGQRARTALVMVSERAHLVEGVFDADAMVEMLHAAIDQAVADGFGGLRATGDIAWELGPDRPPDTLIRYEAQLDAAFAGRRVVGLCQYRRQDHPPNVLKAVMHSHNVVVLDSGAVASNPYHRPPRGQDKDSDAASLEWMMSTLRETADAGRRREQTIRREVHDLLSHQLNARLARVLECMSDAFLALDLNCRVTYANAEAVRISGRTREELVGSIIWDICPDGSHSVLADELRRAMREQVVVKMEYRTHDQSRWLEIDAYPLPEGLNVFYRDISERKRAEAKQTLLMREVDHRAKNALAVAQNIVMLTRADTIPNFVTAVQGRIAALARVHTLLARAKWSGARLDVIVAEELEPYCRGSTSRAVIEGPPVSLIADAAQPVAMVIHELATNAAKYGALSARDGRVSVHWEVEPQGGLRLEWRESGGPVVTAPARSGFGSQMITLAVSSQLDGSASFEWAPDGLSCTIAMAPDRLAGTGPAHAVREEQQSCGPVTLDAKRILVVEDDALLAMGMQFALEALGCEVVGPAPSVETALRLAAAEPLDAAVLDVNLRGRESWTVADVLRERGIPHLFTTGYTDVGSQAAARGAGVLIKPFSPDQLGPSLRKLIRQGGHPH